MPSPPSNGRAATATSIEAESLTQIEDRLQQAVCEFLDAGNRTQKLADISGVDPGVLSRYVNGNRGLSLHTAGLLCQALGLKLGKPSKPKPA